MERVFITYKLNPDVTRAMFESFSKDLDQVVTPHQRGVLRFQAHIVEAVTAASQLPNKPFDVIETVDVASFEAWLQAIGSDGMKPVIAEFERIADQASVQMIRVLAV